MKNIGKGILSGLIATLILSVLMVAKEIMALMPQMNVIHMLTDMAHHQFGAPDTHLVGWIIHFLIGSVLWGILFTVLTGVLPGKGFAEKGVSFSILAWLLMMILVMPLAGKGFFGVGLDIRVPIMTLILHLIFGAVLGSAYKAFRGDIWPPAGQ